MNNETIVKKYGFRRKGGEWYEKPLKHPLLKGVYLHYESGTLYLWAKSDPDESASGDVCLNKWKFSEDKLIQILEQIQMR